MNRRERLTETALTLALIIVVVLGIVGTLGWWR
jgi:hypothetical protein